MSVAPRLKMIAGLPKNRITEIRIQSYGATVFLPKAVAKGLMSFVFVVTIVASVEEKSDHRIS
jgi:hypothetical protein